MTPPDDALSESELREAWPALSNRERAEGLKVLPRAAAEDLFFTLGAREQERVLRDLPADERRTWLRVLPPDDAADLLQQVPAGPGREGLLALLDEPTRHEVEALLAYQQDRAGGLMSPRFGRLRPEMSIAEALTYLRQQTRVKVAASFYVYVLDPAQTLLGVVSFRDLLTAPAGARVQDVMSKDVVTVDSQLGQVEVARLFRSSRRLALPVIDKSRHMQGVVTADDIVDAVSEDATSDIQKLGGSEELGEPYLQIGFTRMFRKRAGWLSALFLGEMLTATAMGFFEKEIDKAVVLALFVPLIISSGGNSGSQATSLVIRAMALGEVKLRDWFRVVGREIFAGLALGATLGCIGFVRILLWQKAFHTYGQHYLLIGFTVGASLIGVVTFGTLAGSLLPFILRRLGFDPASASAPFVATLVDVTGLIIYFTTASAIMRGTLL